jgi:hypothetical protein
MKAEAGQMKKTTLVLVLNRFNLEAILSDDILSRRTTKT